MPAWPQGCPTWTSRMSGRRCGDCWTGARRHGRREVALVTGAGFGPAATETLVLRLVERMGATPVKVRVAAAAAVASQGDGVRQTVQESLPQGAITYRDGEVVREALGSGATMLTFGGGERQMLPGPVGDLETARAGERRGERDRVHRESGGAPPRNRLLGVGRGRRARMGGSRPPSCGLVKVSAPRRHRGRDGAARAGGRRARRVDSRQSVWRRSGHRRYGRPGDTERTAGMNATRPVARCR